MRDHRDTAGRRGDRSAPDESTPITVERDPTEAVFGLLANEVRVEILRALGETPDTPVAFSTLYDRVDLADTGNFNYHLGELLGTFVRKDDAYELTHAGRQVVGAMHAGTYTADAAVDPIRLDWDCLLCGGPMTAAYRDERAVIHCADCEMGARFAFPPGSLDQYDHDELPGAFARWLRLHVQRSISGFCGTCAGRTRGELARLPGGTADDPRPSQVAYECARCGTTATISGSSLFTYHPLVEGFLHEHGFDTKRGHPTHIWAQLDVFDSRILGREPPRIEVRFGVADELVTGEITADARLEHVRRRPVEESG